MYTAVIKFDTLADTVRSTTQHHDLVTTSGGRLTLLIIGGVHIGGRGGKLSRTGINPLIDRTDVEFVAQLAQLPLAHP